MAIKNVTLLGTGVLGAQIAFQTAYHGFNVTSYDIDDEKIAVARQTMDGIGQAYLKDLPDATPQKISETVARIGYATDLGEAVKDTDLVIEAIPEILGVMPKSW